jgi:hypothetical protein
VRCTPGAARQRYPLSSCWFLPPVQEFYGSKPACKRVDSFYIYEFITELLLSFCTIRNCDPLFFWVNFFLNILVCMSCFFYIIIFGW